MSTQQNAKFNAEQYAMILNFLEDPQNKAKVFGVSGKTEIGVPPPRKIEAWKELAALINTKFKGKYKVDHKSVADRWRTYFNKYKVARDKSNTTGFGLTDDDKKKNIHTVQAKLDMMCPHYERMHALIGDRPNVNPIATFDSGSITSETDLNEVLRFSSEDVPSNLDDDPLLAFVDTVGPDDSTTNANEVGVGPNPVLVSNEDDIFSPPSVQNQPSEGREPEPEDDDLLPTELDSPAMVVGASKHHRTLDNTDPKKSKKDRRKELPTLSATKNPTQARNYLAQTIQDCASAKAAALVAIEEKRLKFEQMKWETEREEREVKRRDEQEENERRRQEDKEDERVRRAEDKEDERVRRAEGKAEKCRERRFALLQTMLADGKSPDEIKEVLSMLL